VKKKVLTTAKQQHERVREKKGCCKCELVESTGARKGIFQERSIQDGKERKSKKIRQEKKGGGVTEEVLKKNLVSRSSGIQRQDLGLKFQGVIKDRARAGC